MDKQTNEWCDPDEWGEMEQDALEHMLHTLGIMGIAIHTIDIKGSNLHASIEIDGQPYELVAIRGSTYENCRKYCERELPRVNHKRLLISRDQDNSICIPRFSEKITHSSSNEIIITSPDSGLIQRD